MPVCHRFKNFQPQGLELRQLQFKQTQRRLHPQWHQIELHCKNTPRSGEKKNQFFSLSSLMFENYKNAILLQHWTIARSPSWKQTNSSTNVFPQPSVPKGGESTTAHLQQNTTKKKKIQRIPQCPQPWNAKIKSINPALQHSNPPFTEQEGARGKGCGAQWQIWGWGPRVGDGDLSLTLFAIQS